MELYLLDENFVAQSIIDNFKSLIWTKRYYTCGDFELYMPASVETLEVINACRYATRDDDDSVMIIERIEITTDVDEGDFYIISGRSLESLLTRRIVWSQTVLNVEDAAEAIYQLLDDNIVDPTDVQRQIPLFLVDQSFEVGEPLVTQITGTDLMTAINNICVKYRIGFKITYQKPHIVFSLYQGSEVDATFSEEYDNLISSDYYFDSTNYKTVARVAGEGEGTARKHATVYADYATGINRREMYVDARDVSSNEGEIPLAKYSQLLATRGFEKLVTEYNEKKGFEGEVAPTMTYHYKVDYNLGDIVTVDNGYGVTSKPRIIEIIENWDVTGYKVIPTFEKWEV